MGKKARHDALEVAKAAADAAIGDNDSGRLATDGSGDLATADAMRSQL